MKAKKHKYIIISFLVLTLILVSQNAMGIPVEIFVPNADMNINELGFSVEGRVYHVIDSDLKNPVIISGNIGINTTELPVVSENNKRLEFINNGELNISKRGIEVPLMEGIFNNLEIELHDDHPNENFPFITIAGTFSVSSAIEELAGFSDYGRLEMQVLQPRGVELRNISIVGNATIHSVPEPSLILLLGSLCFCVGWLERRKIKMHKK